MRQFQCGVTSKRNHDSMMGREGKANFGHPFATSHLQDTMSLGHET